MTSGPRSDPGFTGYDAPIRQSLITQRLLLGVPYFLGLGGTALTLLLVWQLSWPASWFWRLISYTGAWSVLAGALAYLTRAEPLWMELLWVRLFEADELEV